MLSGVADPEARSAGAPTMPDLATEAVTLERVDLLQVLSEIEGAPPSELLPPALHPTLPGVVSWLVYSCSDSPWGAFRLAQTRIECRSGTRPRGFLVSGVIDNEPARVELASRWGYQLQPGEIDFRRRYDGVSVSVVVDGRPMLEIGLRDPVDVPPEVVQFVASVHPANTPRGYRLVQVDPSCSVERAERGDPQIDCFDAEAWGEQGIRPAYPISAVVCLADVTLPKLRFLNRPGETAFSGTEQV